ncbi:HXXEE domain-containing protein [Kribbella hippodromi]|uniref:HXXEE domain-containing protein n=1 Tax=Kribbella hippodromi TaxID=434347 RepID=A0ABP4PZN2_9ACTN
MKKVAWGLLAAWILHDLEELATMPSFSRSPDLPQPLPKVLPMSGGEAATAIGLTGIVMAAASAAGARTGGRSKLFQASLLGFGWHAGTHIAQSVVLRRYTPGLVTTPLVVIPYSVWAWRRLKAAEVPVAPADRRLDIALAAVVPLAHVVARLPRLKHRFRTSSRMNK